MSRSGAIAFTIAFVMTGGSVAQAEATKGTKLEIPIGLEGPMHSVTALDLLTLREIGGVSGKGLSVSPDGKFLAFELHQSDPAMNSYHVAWFVAPTVSGGKPVNVGDGGAAILFRDSLPNGRISGAWITHHATWSPDSRGIVYRKRVNGETQIWWSSRDGTEREQLTNNAADVETFYWNRDGSRLYFTTDADRAEMDELSDSRYRTGYVFDYNQTWSTIDGSGFRSQYELTGGQPRVWILDVKSRVEQLASDKELAEYGRLKESNDQRPVPMSARHVARTDDGNGLAWVQPDDPDKQGGSPPMTLHASLAADGSNPVRCPATECTGILDYFGSGPLRDVLHWNAIEDEIIFARNEGMGYSKRTLYGWRIGEKSARKILSTDEWISDCSIVRGRAMCFRETASYPRTVVSINLANGSVETLVDPNPEFRKVLLGDVELFEWKNSVGYGTFGYVVRPPDYIPGNSYPLVIVGYRARNALRGGTGNEYPVHLLAANGFVVLVYDRPTTYRAQEFHADPLELSKANWGPDLFDYKMPLATFDSAIRILTEEGLVDRTRVGVTGLSNGVGHVNYALINSDLFAAAITSSSDFSPSNYFLVGAHSKFFKEHRRVIGAGRYGSPEGFLWQRISLALNAERVRAPLLVNAAQHEHALALEEITALIENDKPVEMMVHPDEYHIKWQPAHRLAVYERNVDWFNFWLRGVEDSDPDKAEQYVRWRALRERHILNLEMGGKEYSLLN